MATETQTRGAGLISSANWIKQAYGPATFKEVLASLPEAPTESLHDPQATEWYPATHLSAVWSAVRRIAHPDDPEGFERAMRELGRSMASDNLSTVFRVLLAFIASPEQMCQNLDRFWNQSFQGLRVENDESELELGRGTTRVYGAGAVHHLAPVACGWTEFGFEKAGAEEIQVLEEAYAEDETAADPLVFRMSWR